MNFLFFIQSKTSNFMDNAAKVISIQSKDKDTQSEDIVAASKSVFHTADNIVKTLNTSNKVRL